MPRYMDKVRYAQREFKLKLRILLKFCDVKYTDKCNAKTYRNDVR